MSVLFTRNISNWDDWGKVYQDIAAWRPLIRHIYAREHLPFTEITYLTPGSNAVFHVGDTVVKIFAPRESGIDSTTDVETEAFAMRRATVLGLSVPKCIVCDTLEDKYRFSYMIMEYVPGKEFTEIAGGLSREEKIALGRNLRRVLDKMNTPCESFNGIDVVHDKGRYKRWEKYATAFQSERISYIRSRSYGEEVFVHGDLCGDNILFGENGEMVIIDFADAVLAPVIYEHAHIACELFEFDRDYLTGFFGAYDIEWLTNLCFEGLLLHDFGGDIIKTHIAEPDEIPTLDVLKERIKTAIESAVKKE